MTNAFVGGAIPDKNGFIEGYGITVHNELAVNTGMVFRIYRNGTATDCTFMITDGDNDGHGAVRARNFNTNPAPRLPDEEAQVFYYKAQERIAVRAEAPIQKGIGLSTAMDKFNVFLYYVSDIITPETLSSQRFGGGNVGGVPGGGDEDDEGEEQIPT